MQPSHHQNPYSLLEKYRESLQAGSPPPLITDESGGTFLLEQLTGVSPISIYEAQTGDFPNIFFYSKEEEKKEFSIIRVRECLRDMSIAPYSGKSIYVLHGFDSASIEAQNAFLKGLEDIPSYAGIILIVENEEALLDTIHSRTITLRGMREKENILSEEIKNLIESYLEKKSIDFIGYLYNGKFDKNESIALLIYSLQHDIEDNAGIYQRGIEDIYTTNENPRNILERVFLCERNI